MASRASFNIGGDPVPCCTASAAPVPIVVVLVNHTDAPGVEVDAEEIRPDSDAALCGDKWFGCCSRGERRGA